MKHDARKTQKKTSDDLKTFEKLPARTRESLLLGDKAAKATGKDRAHINRKIKQRSSSVKP